ncbi:MAG: glycerol dehydrogenase [Mycoplasmataceae bacterium]|nr:glycerol dehydrogenase [Mycoplasmataceae bacterium]
MSRIIGSPLRYIQGNNQIENIGNDIKDWGTSFFFLVDKVLYDRYVPIIKKTLAKQLSKAKVTFERFAGECTMKECKRIASSCQKAKADCLITFGGGKGCDTGKVAAALNNIHLIVFATAASTDAPCSHSSIIYKENGEFDQYFYSPIKGHGGKSPDVVIVDCNIIAQAPARLLACGLGDALSTYFEARSCHQTEERNITEWKGQQSLTGYALAKLCYEAIIADGEKAMVACDLKVSTKALENVVEANTYLSTIGFESGGLGAAHSIQDALGIIPAVHKNYHGEKVAFGTICHLVLENASFDEIKKVIKFCYNVGLPITLEDLFIGDVSDADLKKVAAKATGPGVPMGNMPFKVHANDVFAAIKVADRLGKQYKEKRSIKKSVVIPYNHR